MKVFISWSGKLSKECAELLCDWIKCTLQASAPWISSKDIDKGSLWFNEISDQLKDTTVGIVCLTKDNKEKPWILFESGALAKGLSANRVCTFLINLKPSELDNPLAQFNHTMPDREGMKGLLATINKELDDDALEQRILDQVFDTYWERFETKYQEIVESEPEGESADPTRSKDDILEEILYTTRTMDRRIRQLERHSKARDPLRSHMRRMSKEEADTIIHNSLKHGLSPDDIIGALDGAVPPAYVRNQLQEELRRIGDANLNDDENA
jgi:hypothetical protein